MKQSSVSACWNTRSVHSPFVWYFLVALLLAAGAGLAHAEITGTVIDASTHKPIAGAFVTLDGVPMQTDTDGNFHYPAPAAGAVATATHDLRVRSIGYERKLVALPATAASAGTIALTPFVPRAVYLSVYGIGSGVLRPAALKLAEEHHVNALVIDIKGDAGLVGYRSEVPLATTIGARRVTTVRDMKALLAELHARGIYTIGRIVTFKDNLLARSHPELAVHTASGALFQDREGLAWTDPFQAAVWNYNLQLAEEAAKLGFDEIQFDYIRFPDTRGLTFSKDNTEAGRIATITGFLTEARRRLQPYDVFLGADIFGYTCWNTNDTFIGQHIEDLAKPLDVLSPMLYPSGFQFGIPGYRNPIQNPYEIVLRSLQRARERTGLSPLHFRPWLQAFRDYAFDRRVFGPDEIQQQISAADRFGSGGWMLWNPRNVYTAADFQPATRMTMKEPAAAPSTGPAPAAGAHKGG